MVFHRFDRQVFLALESTEGTAETIAVGDFIETLEDVSYTITPFGLERPLVRPAFTKVPNYHASTGITSSDTVVAQIEITFTVEMAAATAGNTTTAPPWENALLCCGFEKFSAVKYETISGGTITSGPLLHREKGTQAYQLVSTHFTGDTRLYYTGTDPSTTTCTGAVSGAAASTITNTATAAGFAYGLSMAASAGNGSSATIELCLDGRRVTAKGCRGNVSFNFTAMDRCLMTFTMSGIVHNIDDNGANRTGISYGAQKPPTFVGAGLSIMEASGSTNYTGALFQSMTLDLGTQTTLREDANSANGWKAAQITDRAPTITANPDAIVGGNTSATVYDYFEAFAEGTPTRMAFDIGTALGGNAFEFKMPALQWSGVADGDRDNYTIYDCTAMLTGGEDGDSVVHDATGTTQLYDNKGADNDLVIIAH